MDSVKDDLKVFLCACILPACAAFALFCVMSCGWSQQPGESDIAYLRRRAETAEKARSTAEEVTKAAAPFLPPPLNYIATLGAAALGEYGRKTITRKARNRRRRKPKETRAA